MFFANKKFHYNFLRIQVVVLILIPIILLLLPATFFDNGKTICLSQLLANTECYACGLTRGIQHLIHFDFEEAYAYNMGSFIVFPLIGFLWIKWIIDSWKKSKRIKKSLEQTSQISQ
ncbi:MAG: hypothetical protein RLY16_2280 [Bacteroidota bacterium]|jgi:hypothetical protein